MIKCATSPPRGPSSIRRITSSGARLPTAKTIVENSTSHGTTPAKMEVGVDRSSTAPSTPPHRLKIERPVTLTSATSKILPGAGERRGEQCYDARRICIDGVEPGEQQCGKR